MFAPHIGFNYIRSLKKKFKTIEILLNYNFTFSCALVRNSALKYILLFRITLYSFIIFINDVVINVPSNHRTVRGTYLICLGFCRPFTHFRTPRVILKASLAEAF